MMENRRKYNGLNGLLAVLGPLLLGARAQQTEVKLVGSEVTMVPIYTGNPIEINWKKDGNKLVDMEVTPPNDPKFYRLEDRATIDRTNGRLTIKDLTVEDSGVYRAEVLVNNVYQYTEIRLTVRAQQEEIQWVGSEVALVPRYTKDLKEIIWKKNNIIVVEMKLNPWVELTFDLPRDRATIDVTNGALTIKNLNTNDSGNYTAEALLKNNNFDKTEITLTVRAQQVEEKWVGDYVILKPQYIGVPAEIIWRKGTQKVVHINLIPQEEPTLYSILEGRATIDRTNGALTIKNLTIEDSGPYKAEVVSVDGISYFTKINLTVYAQQVQEKLVGDYGILKPQYIGVPSEIIWRKGTQKVAHKKLSPQEEPTFYLFLEGRATIDRTSGALTIKDLTIEDSGPYKAEVVSVNGISYFTKINLNLRAQQKEIQLVGSEVTLVAQYTEALKEITWRRNNTIVVEAKLNPLEELTFNLSRDRVTICTNGALTIKNLNINDSGNYTAEALLEDGTNDKTEIILTVRECSSLSGWIIGLMWVQAVISIIIFLIAALVLFWVFRKNFSILPKWFYHLFFFVALPVIPFILGIIELPIYVTQYNCISGGIIALMVFLALISFIIMYIFIIILAAHECYNENQRVRDFVQMVCVCLPCCKAQTQVTKAESEVTLEPQYIGKPSEICWKKDGKKLVDLELNPPEDPTFYRLQDRATIDGTNGRLTIRDLTIEDSGLYRAEVFVNDDYQYTKIPLAVRESCQCITVKFQTEDHPKGIINSCLTIHNVKPEDHVLKVLQSDGEKHELDIKETDGIVIIRTEDDRVTLTVPDTGKVTKITLKKGGVTLFQWKVSGLTLHTNNITLESGFVTVKDAEGRGSYKVKVHSTNNRINTLQQEANNQGNEPSTNRDAGCEAVETVLLTNNANNQGNEPSTNREAACEVVEMVPLTNNGAPESQPIVTFHPVNLTNKKTTWKKDGQLVKIIGKIIKSGQCGNLTINNVTSDDKGKYTAQCKGQDQEQEFFLRM